MKIFYQTAVTHYRSIVADGSKRADIDNTNVATNLLSFFDTNRRFHRREKALFCVEQHLLTTYFAFLTEKKREMF